MYLVGESLFRRRMSGPPNPQRLALAVVLVALIPLSPHVSALLLSAIVAVLLGALSTSELRRHPASRATAVKTSPPRVRPTSAVSG